jgi:hypothetical protein
MIFSACIFPNGIDNNSVELHFNDQQHKDYYVKQEYTYCKKEYSLYLGEMFNSNERKKFKEQFHKKRVEFAKKNNFEPVNPKVWKQQFHNNNNQIA